MAHIGKELRLCAISRLCRAFGLAQAAFGADVLGDVACRSAIAEKAPRGIEDRVAADRDHAFGVSADPPRVNKVAERLVPVQRGIMLVPQAHILQAAGSQLLLLAADALARILAERADFIGDESKAMLLVGFPKPIRAGSRKIAKTAPRCRAARPPSWPVLRSAVRAFATGRQAPGTGWQSRWPHRGRRCRSAPTGATNRRAQRLPISSRLPRAGSRATGVPKRPAPFRPRSRVFDSCRRLWRPCRTTVWPMAASRPSCP